MCFSTKTVRERAKKNKEPLICFKVLKELKKGLSSPYRRRAPVWTIGVNRVDKDFQNVASFRSVDRGLHSCRTLSEALSHKRSAGGKAKVYVASIPAGSKVYANAHQYCSNQLTILAEVVTKKRK